MSNQIEILGVNIFNTSYKDFIVYLEDKIKNKEVISFHNVNASILLKSDKSENFRNILKSFNLLLSDGIGVYWASKMLYGKSGLKERLTGTDLYYQILDLANKNKLKCFFYGGSEKAVSLLRSSLMKNFPDINISGIISRVAEFKTETLERIQNSGADLIFVGLGTPYQEEWISKYKDEINIPVRIAVGSGIEFISGAKKRAPGFLRKTGLEWIYRIYLEPARLWKRYIFGIPIFMFKIFKLKVKLLVNK